MASAGSSKAEPKKRARAPDDDPKPAKKKKVAVEDEGSEIGRALAELNDISRRAADNIVRLIAEDNTVPFVARYRRALVDDMGPEKLHRVYESHAELCRLRKSAQTFLAKLAKKGPVDPALKKAIMSARTECQLNLLREPYKETGGFAEELRKSGLDVVVKATLAGERPRLSDYRNDDMSTTEAVQENVVRGIAAEMHKDPGVLDLVKDLFERLKSEATIECGKARASKQTKDTPKHKELQEKFSSYLDFKMKLGRIKSHQILAINRGEELKVLSVKVLEPDRIAKDIQRFCSSKWKNISLLYESITEMYKRFIQPWFKRQIRKEMTTAATKESVEVFCANLKRLLLTQPIKNKNILGIDPGFKHGCKLSAIDKTGNVLEVSVVYPKFHSNNKNDEEGFKLSSILKKHSCKIIALGDGTACKETEKWLNKIGAVEHASLVIVPEQGASVYSCSPEASLEFPKMDPNLISAVSLARRAMDPLSELIKVNPQHLGVGMYQHDVPPKILSESLDNVVINCVSFVGVDLNTASHNLLVKIAGLSDKRAQNIIKYRDENSEFKKREDLMKVAGIGEKTFKQCAGFLRIHNGKNKLDRTEIHPESYKITLKLLENLKMNKNDVGSDLFAQGFKSKSSQFHLDEMAETLHCTRSDIELIVEALSQSPEDNRLRNVQPVFSIPSQNDSNKKIEEGTVLTGIVRNVTTFGVFVDCGNGSDHGLIHNSQIGKNAPPQLGDKVIVSVLPSFKANKISLKLINIVGCEKI